MYMKRLKYFILLILIAISSEMVFAQNYTIPIGRKYILRRYNIFFPLDRNEIIYFDATGDTIINGNIHTIISRNKHTTIGSNTFVRWYGTKCIEYIPEMQRDTLLFDESWKVGDTISVHPLLSPVPIVETGLLYSRKYWKWEKRGTWLQGIGYIDNIPFLYEINANSHSTKLICCIEANGDTLYVDRDILHFIQTSVNNPSAGNLTITPADGGCLVTLGSDAVEWTATLYNSNGVTVAQQQCSGSEAFLPTDSKGTHILVVKAGDRVVKKKIMLR